MNSLILLDLAPDPSPASSIAGLILLAVAVSILVVVFIVAFVFLLKYRHAKTTKVSRGNSPVSPVEPTPACH